MIFYYVTFASLYFCSLQITKYLNTFSLFTNHYSLKKLSPIWVGVLCLVVPRRVEQRWFRLSDEPAVLISASSLAFLAKKPTKNLNVMQDTIENPVWCFYLKNSGEPAVSVLTFISDFNRHKPCAIVFSPLLGKQKLPPQRVRVLCVVVPRRGALLSSPWKGDVLTDWPWDHIVVAAVGFEPTTYWVWTRRSSQLS